ncbi:MAG: hypothetical protein ACK53C_02970 [Pseudomonadota bacterium]
MVRKSPQLAERMGLPDALRRTMRLLDETGTEWREEAPKFWHDVRVPLGLAGALVLALLVATSTWLGKRELAAEPARLQQTAPDGLLLAPTRTTVVRVAPGRTGEAVPTLDLGTRESPTLAELRIDTGWVRGNLFEAAVKRDDGTYWARLDNLVRDSNGELRLALNSGAFATGTYLVELQAVNLRGEGEIVGRFRLRVAPR